jgi:tRNA G18 (ribose-2'-O)-methylase SpoU
MFRLLKIESIDDPALAPYRTMSMQRIFVAEGEKIVRRLLQSALEVSSVLLPEKWLADFTPLIENRPGAIDTYVAPKVELEKLTGYSMYQGVLAVGKIPGPVSLEDAVRLSPHPRLFAALDGINSSENVGALIRNAAAFGVQAIVAGETSSHPYMRRAVRSSMGTVFQLPVVESENLAADLQRLRELGTRSVGADAHEGVGRLTEIDLTGDCCLVFGSEGLGLRSEVSAACDFKAAVPMRSAVDSLNVSAAAAIFFHEADRQRRTLPR